MKNPFTPNFGQVPLVMAGRDFLIDEIAGAFENAPGDPSLTSLLVGARGTGKTALLSLLAAEAQSRGWIAVNVPCAAGMLEEIAQGTEKKAREVISLEAPARITSVTLGQVAGLSWEHEEDNQPTWYIRMSNLLDRLAEEDIGLVITVDEVRPELEEMILLASYYQLFVREERKVALLMAGLPAQVSSLVDNKSVSFLRRASRYQLGSIADNDIRHALEQTAEQSGKTFAKDALDIAVRACEGFPFMMQLVGYRSWQASKEGSVISRRDAEQGVSMASSDMENRVLKVTLDELSDRDLEYLEAMLGDEGVSSTGDIAQRLGWADGYASQYRRRLADRGIIEPQGRGKVRFSLPQVREYLPKYMELRL